MLKLFLWLKYLRKRKIVFLSIAAVALSVALLIVVSSLFNGFIEAFEQSAVKVMGDIVLTPPARFAQYPLFIDRLKKIPDVDSATATLSGHGLLHLGRGDVRAVKIVGIEPESRARVTGFKEFLLRQNKTSGEVSFDVNGSPDKMGGFVGIGVLAEPDEKTDEYAFEAIADEMIGRQVILTTGAGRKLRRKNISFSIADIVFTGVYDLDKSFVYIPIERLQLLLYPEQAGPIAEQLQIKLKHNAEEDAALSKIRDAWRVFAADRLRWDERLIIGTDISTSKQLQSQFVAELHKQMGVLLLIFGIISFSAVLLVFCILYMIVETRRKDIAIIKSCGTDDSSVAAIFVGFGACIGIIGSGLGAALGYVTTKNINILEEWIRKIFGLKLWKSSVYMFSSIPNDIDWHSVFYIVLMAVIAAALGALIPAIVAVRTRPVTILRYE
ncbi:MAG: ABC transporter permease [Planctomycetota bacterium]|jgi:lipoprotein-releasing system permease protein